jgi:succinate-semialdehyde dehydrogenase/glutarate-semialdehyde dehydrogenase
MFQTINPYTNEILETFEFQTNQEIENIVSKADNAYKTWRKTTIEQRADLFSRLAQVLRGNSNRLAILVSKEMGKPIKESRAEIIKCAWACEYYAMNTKKFLADEIIVSDATKSHVSFEALGCILAIMPWNFPFWQVFRFAAPALMAGNVAILKHSPNTSRCGLEIMDLFEMAGFPKGVFTTILADNEQIATVIANPIIKALTLTGSEKAGSSVAASAGKNIKKVVLELGGNDAFIVFADADLEQAVEIAVQSRMLNSGQSCIAAKRFLIEESILDKFVEKLRLRIMQLKFGNPMLEETEVGVIARKDLLEKLHQQVTDSVAKGAKLLTGGYIHQNFYAPTILINVQAGMPAFDEELFGGVFAISSFKTEFEAINLANESKYGLAATIWTQDIAKATLIAKELETGGVFINALVRSDPRLPFGGTKNSGFGRELSYFGIKEFVNIKTVYVG